MKVIFIGNPIEQKIYEKNIKRYVYTCMPDNLVQLEIVDILNNKYQENFSLITINFEDKQKTKKAVFMNVKDATYLKYNDRNSIWYTICIMSSIFKEVIEYIKRYKDEKIVVITNGPYPYYSIPVLIAKLFYKIKYVPFLICAVELPIYRGIKKIIFKMSKYLIKLANATITLVKKSSIDYTNKPYLEILVPIGKNRMILYENNVKYKKIDFNKIVISFTGGVTGVNGIDILLKVIEKLPTNYFFNICGCGEFEKIVKEFSEKYPNKLKYYGLVSSEEAIKIQCKSDFLILIRNKKSKVEEYYSKYATSAKLVEYGLSGVPTLVTNHEAINEKIRPYLNVFNSNNVNSIVKEILRLSNSKVYNKLKEKARKEKEYLKSELTIKNQSKIIGDFLDNIN